MLTVLHLNANLAVLRVNLPDGVRGPCQASGHPAPSHDSRLSQPNGKEGESLKVSQSPDCRLSLSVIRWHCYSSSTLRLDSWCTSHLTPIVRVRARQSGNRSHFAAIQRTSTVHELSVSRNLCINLEAERDGKGRLRGSRGQNHASAVPARAMPVTNPVACRQASQAQQPTLVTCSVLEPGLTLPRICNCLVSGHGLLVTCHTSHLMPFSATAAPRKRTREATISQESNACSCLNCWRRSPQLPTPVHWQHRYVDCRLAWPSLLAPGAGHHCWLMLLLLCVRAGPP